MINSQREEEYPRVARSISKGMGDQFSAPGSGTPVGRQYIKGDG